MDSLNKIIKILVIGFNWYILYKSFIFVIKINFKQENIGGKEGILESDEVSLEKN